MRSLEELTAGDSFWPTIQTWIAKAETTVELLPPGTSAESDLVSLQVTTHSALGAIALNTGGLLVDHRWLRLLAAGTPGVAPSLCDWNGLCGGEALIPGTLIVAWDVIGGIFVVNGDRLPYAPGNVCYFAPDSLDWFDMQMGHSAFLSWCFSERVSKFYQHIRWPDWAAEVVLIPADQALSLYPPPFTAEGKRIEDVSRRGVPALEYLELQIKFGREIGDFNVAKEGAT
jgi:hypothetical protein